MTTQPFVERLEEKRDLRQQLSELDREDESGILFQEWSPGRTMVSLWSTETGEEIVIPRYMADAAITTPREDGQGYRFTSKRESAPAFVQGNVKCFLHPDSDERKSGLLKAAGLEGTRPCNSAHHPSRYAMEEVARSKHKKQWAALQAYQSEARAQGDRERQQKQVDATLELARGARPAAPAKAAAKTCKACGAEITGKLADHTCEEQGG